MIKKIFNFKFKNHSFNKGMSYTELIVVMAIMGIMSSVIIFNDGTFQKRLEIKSLANDVALKIVQAQKLAMAGKMSPLAGSGWTPSYGVYFNKDMDKKDKFIFFVDLNSNKMCDSSACGSSGSEYLDTYSITGGNYIYDLTTNHNTPVGSLSFVFTRPDSATTIFADGALVNVSYANIAVSSQNNVRSVIRVYPSGMIRIN